MPKSEIIGRLDFRVVDQNQNEGQHGETQSYHQGRQHDEVSGTLTKLNLNTEAQASVDLFQKECIELFVNAATTISLPRSIGEIYGLLFSSPKPIPLDAFTERLFMSRGSAHEGLRWLRSIGAVRVVYVPGIRKEHFVAETSLRRLAAGYLRDKIDPHLESGPDRLKILHEAASVDPSKCEFQKSRVTQISNWYKFLNRVLPAVKVLASKF